MSGKPETRRVNINLPMPLFIKLQKVAQDNHNQPGPQAIVQIEKSFKGTKDE